MAEGFLGWLEGVFDPGGKTDRGVEAARQRDYRDVTAPSFRGAPGAQGITNDLGYATQAGMNRNNPTMDPTQQNQARASQWDLVQRLQAQARGEGPSLAQMQLRSAADQNIAQAMALGASQRGSGQAGMLKGIQNQQAGIAGKLGSDSAMLRLQEQMAAQGMLGNTLQGMRGQDIGFQQADVASKLQGTALNDQLLMQSLNNRGNFALGQGAQQLQAIGQNMGAQMANQQNRLAWEQLKRGAIAQNPGLSAKDLLDYAGKAASAVGSAMGGGM